MTSTHPWNRAIVIGASSGMGAELAKQLAAGGCKVALVARREEELNRVAGEINDSDESEIRNKQSAILAPSDQSASRTLQSAITYVHDVTQYREAPGLFQQICRDLGGLDLFIYAAGVMARPEPDEYCFGNARPMIDVNVLGAIAWIDEVAQRFAKAGEGTIVGISSVAGDRGRRGNPAYCASKAALNTYLEGVRNRIGRFGVAVVTIKPGPVDTPMTHGLGKMPFMIPAAEAARGILAAARRKAHTAYVPGIWRPIMFIIRSIPSFIFKKRNI